MLETVIYVTVFTQDADTAPQPKPPTKNKERKVLARMTTKNASGVVLRIEPSSPTAADERPAAPKAAGWDPYEDPLEKI